MKKNLHLKKLQLSRETLRRLETIRLSEVGGGSALCTGTTCFPQQCTSVCGGTQCCDTDDCPA
jgi:hypothetical protein